MGAEDWAARWQELSETVLGEMQAWRAAHPRATFREIEDAVEERINRLRAQMLEEAAQVSAAREWAAAVSGLRAAAGSTRAGDPNGAGAWRATGAATAGLRGVPGLWGRAFPPSMRNSP